MNKRILMSGVMVLAILVIEICFGGHRRSLAIYKLQQFVANVRLRRYLRKDAFGAAPMRGEITPTDPLRLDPDDRGISIT